MPTTKKEETLSKRVNPFEGQDKESIRTQKERAERTLARQKHVVKASEAYVRLKKNPDFKLILEHLENTVSRTILDSVDRRDQQQVNEDFVTAQSISLVIRMLDDLPIVGSDMRKRITEMDNVISEMNNYI